MYNNFLPLSNIEKSLSSKTRQKLIFNEVNKSCTASRIPIASSALDLIKVPAYAKFRKCLLIWQRIWSGFAMFAIRTMYCAGPQKQEVIDDHSCIFWGKKWSIGEFSNKETKGIFGTK